MSDTVAVKPLTRSLVLLAIAAASLAAGAWVFVLRSDDTGEDAAQTVYDRIMDGMSREGMVLHTTATGDECTHREAWIDAELDAVVEEFSYLCDDSEGPDSRTLRRDGRWWQVDTGGIALVYKRDGGCRGTGDEAIIFFAGCHGLEDVKLRVIRGSEYDGHHALALRATGAFQGIDSRVEFDEYLYIDEASGLPIARVQDWRDFYGAADPPTERTITTYSHEFVEREALPGDLFEPVGYRAADPRSNR